MKDYLPNIILQSLPAKLETIVIQLEIERKYIGLIKNK